MDWPDSGQLSGARRLIFREVDRAGRCGEVVDNVAPTCIGAIPWVAWSRVEVAVADVPARVGRERQRAVTAV